jgi:hypothetical protein
MIDKGIGQTLRLGIVNLGKPYFLKNSVQARFLHERTFQIFLYRNGFLFYKYLIHHTITLRLCFLNVDKPVT